MDTNGAKRTTAQAPDLLAVLKADSAMFETMGDYCRDRAWALHPQRVPELIETLLDDKRTFDAMLNFFWDGPWRLHAEKSVERIDAAIGSVGGVCGGRMNDEWRRIYPPMDANVFIDIWNELRRRDPIVECHRELHVNGCGKMRRATLR